MWGIQPSQGRRSFLHHATRSLSAVAFLSLLEQTQETQSRAKEADADPLAARPGHFPATADRIIFLYSTGGVSRETITKITEAPFNQRSHQADFTGELFETISFQNWGSILYHQSNCSSVVLLYRVLVGQSDRLSVCSEIK